MSLMAPGSVLADFEIEGVVGRGGMGVVYRAVQLSLDRPVALKLIAPHLADEQGFRQRFVKESRLAASLDHPHIVPVYGAGEVDGVHYIAMRFVQGVDLRAAVAAAGRLDPGRAAQVVQQVSSALDAAHASGLVHRDVKPANILISQDNGQHAYLTDFGVTKRRSGDTTTSAGWVGTLDYVAPEQLRGEAVDARADTYSLACVLYECLTGRVPFPRDDDAAKMWAHISDTPPLATDLAPDVPLLLSDVIRRAMAKSPRERFPSTGDFGCAVLDAATSHAAERPTKPANAGSKRQSRRPAPTGRLYEREHELRQAEVELDAATTGSSRVLFIEGQAGIGKSRLLSELCGVAESRGFDVYTASGVGLEREFAYGVVRQLFEYRATRLSPGERATLFRGAAALAEPVLLRTDAPGGDPEAEEAESARDRVYATLHGLYWFCAELSERAPVLLAIDDSDRADQASLRFLAHLAPRLEGLRLAVALTRRPAADRATTQLLAEIEEHGAVRLCPAALSAEGSAELLAERLGDGDPEFFSACHRAAHGNPFLLGELCMTIRTDGLAPTASAASMVERLGPRNIAQASLTRVGRVAPRARRLVQAAALMGHATELRHVAALAEVDFAEAARLADTLVGLGVLASSVPVEFVHPVVRTAILEDQPAAARAVLHARVARLLADDGEPGEAVCAHLMQAAPAGDQWAVTKLLQTARAALEQGAPDSAASLLTRALAEPPTADQRTDVLVALGRAEALGPAPESAVDHLRAALATAGDRRLRDQLTAELLSTLWHLGRREELLELARDELARCGPEMGHESRRRLEAALVVSLKFNVAHYAELDDTLQALAPELTGATPADRAILAILAQRRVERCEPVDGAVAAARLALDNGLLNDHAPSLRAPAGVALRALIESDAHDLALHWLGEGLELARRRGSHLGQLTARRLLAELALSAGDLSVAEADARLVAETWREAPSLAAFCAAAALARALVAGGRLEEAEQALAELGDGRRYPGFPNSVVSLAYGELAAERGETRSAHAAFSRAGDDFPSSPWRSGAAMAALRFGEQAVARALADEELSLARRFGAPRRLGIALRAAGLCEGGGGGVALLQESVAVLRASPAKLELARSLCDLGAALRRAKRRADARPLLREALDLAHRSGAEPLEQHAKVELRASGARPRRTALSGVDSLTASELRVCQLAADGLTNAEIAQALFVTRRTVETHLGKAYRKLDIRSRTELATALKGGARPEPVAG